MLVCVTIVSGGDDRAVVTIKNDNNSVVVVVIINMAYNECGAEDEGVEGVLQELTPEEGWEESAVFSGNVNEEEEHPEEKERRKKETDEEERQKAMMIVEQWVDEAPSLVTVGRRSWRVDACKTRRYHGKEWRRRRNKMLRRGIPCTLQYKETDKYHQILVRARPGFCHLASPHVTRRAIRDGHNYHITLGIKAWMKPYDDDWKEPLRCLQDEFGLPKDVVLDVEYVDYNGNIAHIAWWDTTFWGVYENTNFIRAWYGNHANCGPTISM